MEVLEYNQKAILRGSKLFRFVLVADENAVLDLTEGSFIKTPSEVEIMSRFYTVKTDSVKYLRGSRIEGGTIDPFYGGDGSVRHAHMEFDLTDDNAKAFNRFFKSYRTEEIYLELSLLDPFVVGNAQLNDENKVEAFSKRYRCKLVKLERPRKADNIFWTYKVSLVKMLDDESGEIV